MISGRRLVWSALPHLPSHSMGTAANLSGNSALHADPTTQLLRPRLHGQGQTTLLAPQARAFKNTLSPR